MNKTIVVILVVFLLTSPTLAKAGIFGSSYDGCVDPSDDMAGYILEKASGTDLTRSNIEHALELIPKDIEHASYGDIFKWLKVTENAAECFTKRDYLDGLKILGKHTGEFAALTTLEGAASLVAPGLFLPGTLFKWYIDTVVKTLATNGFSDQVTLYIAAMEKCKEEGMTRDFCQQEIKSGYYDFALFHPTGFLVQADSPTNWRLLSEEEFDTSEKRSSKMFASFGSVVSSGITSGEFYDGALTIYDGLVAKYDETFNRIESTAYEKVIMEAKQIAKTNTTTENNNSGFFSNLWGKIVNLFTKNDANTELPAQVGDAINRDDKKCKITVNLSGISFEIKEGNELNQRPTGLTKAHISAGVVKKSDLGEYHIELTFTNEGKRLFSEITDRISQSGGSLSLYINNNLVSSPVVMTKIVSDTLLVGGEPYAKIEQIIGKQNINNPCPEKTALQAQSDQQNNKVQDTENTQPPVTKSQPNIQSSTAQPQPTKQEATTKTPQTQQQPTQNTQQNNDDKKESTASISKTLAVQLTTSHGVPVTDLIDKDSMAWGYMPSLYLLDAVGDKMPGEFCSPKGCGYGSQYSNDGIWKFTDNVPFGTYTLVFTEGECCGSSGKISRKWGGFKKEIHISNDNERFVVAPVEARGAKVPLYVNVKIVNQIGTPIDTSDFFPCYLVDKNGKKISIDTLGIIVCRGSHSTIETKSSSLYPGEYVLRIEKEGYLPFEKTINIPDVSALNDSEARAKIPEVNGSLTLIKSSP